jgi:hypothetical protein
MREHSVAKDVVGVGCTRQDAADVVAILQQVGQALRAGGRAVVVDLGAFLHVGGDVACESPNFASEKLRKKFDWTFFRHQSDIEI